MIFYAGIITQENDVNYGIGRACGVYFSRALDPDNNKKHVLRTSIHNTGTVLNSFTNVSCARVAERGGVYEFQMDFRFDRISWLYSPRYLTVEFRNSSGTKLFAVRFEVKNYVAGQSAEEMTLHLDDVTEIEGSSICCNKWYTVRLEYYYNAADYQASRLKTYVYERGGSPICVSDINAYLRVGKISSAVIVHHATKVRGELYFDNISFAQTDRKYKSNTALEGGERAVLPIYDFEKEIPSSESFNIKMVLKSDDTVVPFDPAKWTSEGGFTSFRHSHSACEIMFIADGEGVLVCDGGEYPFERGNILIIPAGLVHGISSDKYRAFTLSGNFERLYFIDTVTVVRDNIYKEGKKLMELILYNRFGNDEYLDALCEAYVRYILMNMDLTPKNTAASIYKIISKMEKRFGDSDLSVGALLSESGYAEDYIRAEFLSLTKHTPTQYLTGIRMKNAKMMINIFGENMSISEIAERCGVLDISVFSRMFKKHFGISPSTYKKQVFEEKSK